jgi:hypothetical protein
MRRDRRAGLNTGTFISGYEGSPLGGYDLALGRVPDLLKQHNIHFQPGVNEDLAATSVMGSQILETLGPAASTASSASGTAKAPASTAPATSSATPTSPEPAATPPHSSSPATTIAARAPPSRTRATSAS